MFSDPSGFSGDDGSPFAIPRTSSIAKAKRPSVSFAEGTKFTPKERRGSQDAPRKPKSPWGALMLSALQGRGGEAAEGAEPEEAEQREGPGEGLEPPSEAAEADPERYGATPSRPALSLPGGRRRSLSNARRAGPAQAPPPAPPPQSAAEKVLTVYVTVGPTGAGPGAGPGPEGRVQAMLRRLGSLQRRGEEAGRGRGRGQSGGGGGSGGGVCKPPRRKLGARVSVWEQAAAGGPGGGAGGGHVEVHLRKPSRRKPPPLSSPGALGNPAPWPESAPPTRPLSFVLNSVPEHTPAGGAEGDADATAATGRHGNAHTESGYHSLGAGGQIIANQGVGAGTDEGPQYENVLIKHS